MHCRTTVVYFFCAVLLGGGIPLASHFPSRKLVAIATARRRASGICTTKNLGFFIPIRFETSFSSRLFCWADFLVKNLARNLAMSPRFAKGVPDNAPELIR